ncbi:MAG TPA: MFS transporter, partial [Firmicutes bacterium]|nr:MFS transporter [Bacillota bacterium]
TLSWAVTSFLLTITMLLVPLGKAADIYGRKKFFLCGGIIFTLASLLCAVSPSITLLIIFRIMQGCGAALLMGTAVAILSSVFPPGERGRALGISLAATYIGLSAAPSLGGIVTQQFGWRSVFLVTVPLSLLLIILVIWKVKEEWADAKGEKLDYTGSIIYGISLTAMVYGLTLVPQTWGIWFIVTGLAGLLFFIRWEMKVKNPVLNVRLFTRNKAFALSNLAALTNYSSTYALSFLLSLYLQYIKGLDPQSAGFALVSQPLIVAIASPFTGRLSEKIEARILASWGLGFIAAGLVSLVFISTGTSLFFIVASIMVIGIGLAFFVSPNTNAIMGSVQRNYYGVASATLNTMRLTGQLFSMSIAMVIFALSIGQAKITPENHHLFLDSIRTILIIFVLLCGVGITASVARGKVNSEADSPLRQLS